MFEPTERPMFEWGRVDHALAGRKDFADSHRVSNREPEANARAPIIPVWWAYPIIVKVATKCPWKETDLPMKDNSARALINFAPSPG